MMSRSAFMARVALFSALAYVFALASVYIPNVSFIFIVVFAAGVLYGLNAGLMVGGIGEFMWTVFNPLGMAPMSTTVAQIIGMMLVGAMGASLVDSRHLDRTTPVGFGLFAAFGLATGFVFQIVVSGVDAWLYGPFWQYLTAGIWFFVLTIVFNGLIFPACYPILIRVRKRETLV